MIGTVQRFEPRDCEEVASGAARRGDAGEGEERRGRSPRPPSEARVARSRAVAPRPHPALTPASHSPEPKPGAALALSGGELTRPRTANGQSGTSPFHSPPRRRRCSPLPAAPLRAQSRPSKRIDGAKPRACTPRGGDSTAAGCGGRRPDAQARGVRPAGDRGRHRRGTRGGPAERGTPVRSRAGNRPLRLGVGGRGTGPDSGEAA